MKTITSGVVGVSNSSLIKVATFNYDGTTEIVYTSIVLESLRTDSSYDCTFYPMLMKDTHTADVTYEQYGASPSPDYPSEIETVGSNVNEFDMNNVTTVYNGEKNINEIISNKLSGNYKFVKTLITNTKLVANNTYTVSFKAKKNEGTYSNNLGFQIFDTDGKVTLQMVENSPALSEKYQIYSFTFTITANINVTALLFQLQQNASEVIISIKDIKLEKGSVATPYSPYGMGSVEKDVVNKNYLTKAQQQTKNFNNVNFEINENSEINIQGLANASGEIAFELERPCKMSNLINKTVELIVEGMPTATMGMRFLDGNTRLFELIPNSKTVTLDLDESYMDKSITAIQFYVNNTADYNLIIKPGIYTEFQTEFTPHQSQTAIMPIQQEMLEGDYIAGVEHHEWEKIELTGDEAWNLDDTVGNIRQYTIVLSVLSQYSENNISVISNCFKGVTFELSWLQDNSITILSNSVSLRIMTSNYTTVEDFKVYLKQQYEAGTPVTVYYKLATPINLELTSEQKAIRDTKLYTYKNITNISVSDELASIDVEYKKDQDTINKNYENRLAALEAATIS